MWPDADSFIDWNWGNDTLESHSDQPEGKLPRVAIIMVFEVEAYELQLTLYLNSRRKDKVVPEESTKERPFKPDYNFWPGGSWALYFE